MSNESKHTLGPWEAAEFGVPDKPGVFHEGFAVCTIEIPLNLHRKEAEANARLIAAAPDLLEACKLAASRLNDDTNRIALTAIRAAIAKAGGE